MNLLFIHGAGDPNASDGSFILLRRLVDYVGFDESKVTSPILPYPDSPSSAGWFKVISSHISKLDEVTTILTHSLGGSCSLHALSSGPPLKHLKHLILVATPHWGRDPNWSAESFVLPDNYHENLTWIKSIDLVYSKDDEVVPIEHMYYYHKELPWAATHILYGMDHVFKEGDLSLFSSLLRKNHSGGSHLSPRQNLW